MITGKRQPISCLIFTLLPALGAIAATAAPAPAACAGSFRSLNEAKIPAAASTVPYSFKVARDAHGLTAVDLDAFRNDLSAGIQDHDRANPQAPLPAVTKYRLFVDNQPVKEVPADAAALRWKLKPDEQYSVRLEAIAADGTVLERTLNNLLEKTKIRSVNPVSYAGERPFALHSPLDAKLGIDGELSQAVQKIGRGNIVYVWKNPADPRVASLGADTDFRVLRDPSGRITGYTAIDGKRRAAGKAPFRFASDEATVKVDAAFNENSFLWDDSFTCLHTMTFDPELCRKTLGFWFDVQKSHGQGEGDIPREVLKSNGTSYNVFQTVHLGQAAQNGSYSNPYILGDVVESLVDQTGGMTEPNRELAQDALASMRAYAKWLDANRVVKDADGKMAGYWITDLGSGMDNIGRAPNGNFSGTGYVDELARRIELERSSARLSARLGDFASAKQSDEKATELDKLLNDRYWSEKKGFYYDLVPGKDGKLVRQEDMPTVGGFWPLFSRSASPGQMSRIEKDWYSADRFGGDFPVRSLPAVMQNLRPGSYHPEGGYWRGGNWAPTDVVKALGEERSGRPDLAAQTIDRKLSADTVVSNDHVKAGGRKTVFEFLGTDGKGHPIPGIQEENGHRHQTRADFVGWGGTPHTFGKLRESLGVRPVAGFGGPASELGDWMKFTSESPSFSNASYFARSPLRSDPAQQKLFGEGYLEINPPFDLGAEPVRVSGYNYGGSPIDLTVQSAGTDADGKRLVEITVKSDQAIDINLAFDQMGKSREGYGAVATSPITKVKTDHGGTRTIVLPLSPPSP